MDKNTLLDELLALVLQQAALKQQKDQLEKDYQAVTQLIAQTKNQIIKPAPAPPVSQPPSLIEAIKASGLKVVDSDWVMATYGLTRKNALQKLFRAKQRGDLKATRKKGRYRLA